MRIIVPYANGGSFEFQAVCRNLDVQGIAYDPIDCSGDERAYVDLLRTEWETGKGFIVVEHDICPWPGALAELQDCDQDQCAFPYIQGNRLAAYLGCTKFSALLTSEVPFPLDRIDPNRNPADHPDPTMRLRWTGMDEAIARRITPAGFGMHIHWPPVVHLNPAYQVHPDIDLQNPAGVETLYNLTYA